MFVVISGGIFYAAIVYWQTTRPGSIPLTQIRTCMHFNCRQMFFRGDTTNIICIYSNQKISYPSARNILASSLTLTCFFDHINLYPYHIPVSSYARNILASSLTLTCFFDHINPYLYLVIVTVSTRHPPNSLSSSSFCSQLEQYFKWWGRIYFPLYT